MILVTGATGNVGRHLVRELVEAGEQVRALTRDPDKARAQLPDAAEPVRADSAEELSAALDGAHSLFVNPAAFQAGTEDLLNEAERRGVRRIVALSSSSVTFADPPGSNAIADMHRRLEADVENTGLEWTHLRPDGFSANTLQWAPAIRAGENPRGPYAAMQSACIHEADIAAVGARALLTDELLGQAPVLTGPESVSFTDQARLIGEALGRPVHYVEIPPEEARAAMLASGAPEGVVDTMLRLFAERVGQVADVSPEVERITGRPGRTYAQWARDHIADFQ